MFPVEFIERELIPEDGQVDRVAGVGAVVGEVEADLAVVEVHLVVEVPAEVGNFEQFLMFLKYLLKKTCSFPKMDTKFELIFYSLIMIITQGEKIWQLK